MTRFQGKYRIESTRLAGWDYASPGFYFVTICLKTNNCLFGSIVDGMVKLSPLGELVCHEWLTAPRPFPGLSLDEWVLMPNHLHGIVGVSDDDQPAGKPATLGTLISHFKATTIRKARRLGFKDFAWQSRYYDHIIRNERALQAIRRYIQDNPYRWEADCYYREQENQDKPRNL